MKKLFTPKSNDDFLDIQCLKRLKGRLIAEILLEVCITLARWKAEYLRIILGFNL